MIFTNSECIGCNKCIRSCPAELANVAEGERIEVNADACISCGGCFDNCRHGARDYEDDTEMFLSDIEKGKKYSVIVAPAFIANYPKEYKKIFGYLKKKGVVEIYRGWARQRQNMLFSGASWQTGRCRRPLPSSSGRSGGCLTHPDRS